MTKVTSNVDVKVTTTNSLTTLNKATLMLAKSFYVPVPCGSHDPYIMDFQAALKNVDPFLKELTEYRAVLSYKCLMLNQHMLSLKSEYNHWISAPSTNELCCLETNNMAFSKFSIFRKLISIKHTLIYYIARFNRFCSIIQADPTSPVNMSANNTPLMFFWTTSVMNKIKALEMSQIKLTVEYGYMDTIFESIMLGCLEGCIEALWAIHYNSDELDVINSPEAPRHGVSSSSSTDRITGLKQMSHWLKAAKKFELLRKNTLVKWLQVRASDYICNSYVARNLSETIAESSDRFIVDLRDRCFVGYLLMSIKINHKIESVNAINVPILNNSKITNEWHVEDEPVNLDLDAQVFNTQLYSIKAKLTAAIILRSFKHNQSAHLHMLVASCLRSEILLELVVCWAHDNALLYKTPYILAALTLANNENCNQYTKVIKSLYGDFEKDLEISFQAPFDEWLFLEQIPILGAITRQHVHNSCLISRQRPFLSMCTPLIDIGF
jgi:hypothetical protein